MSVSRPKVLFTVAFFDGVSIVLSSMAAAWLLAASDAGSMMALVRAALVAVLTISALHVK